MIFVSSACARHDRIDQSVMELAEAGFRNIELTGGTSRYEGFEDDLLTLKNKYNLQYRCHNYFPPPSEHFVMNLASMNDEIYEQTMRQIREALTLSRSLGATKYGVHAGFLTDIKTTEIGQSISKRGIADPQVALARFQTAFEQLDQFAAQCGVTLYVENNVISEKNYRNYDGSNLFLLTLHDDFLEMSKMFSFELLLDLAHLKVSCASLGKSFAEETGKMLKVSNYIHVSENDGTADSNQGLYPECSILKALNAHGADDFDVTLEVYSGLSETIKSYELIEDVLAS